MNATKRLTTEADPGNSVRNSKNFSSRRDLKELIFVDQKAFAANIERSGKQAPHPNTRSPMVKSGGPKTSTGAFGSQQRRP